MSKIEIDPIALERAMEQLRQERETFNHQKSQDGLWFSLRLAMGYASIVLLTSIMAISAYILVNSHAFPGAVVTSAGAALFVDVLGLLVGVWKIVLKPDSATKLAPVTQSRLVTAAPSLGREANLELPPSQH